MKNLTPIDLALRWSLALAATVFVILWTPTRTRSADPKQGLAAQEAKLSERCRAIEDMKHHTLAEMGALDGEMRAELASMDSVTEERKVCMMGTVLIHIVEQRSAMNRQLAVMQSEITQHLMQHMLLGKECMAQCPLIQGITEKTPLLQAANSLGAR